MLPQLASGGWTPSPRKLSTDSNRMISPTESVVATTSGAITLGRMWRRRICGTPAPRLCAARTKSCRRVTRVAPRTSRAAVVQPTSTASTTMRTRLIADAPAMSLVRIVVLAVLVGWTTAARLVRGATLVTRRQDFVRAAQSLGAGVPHILRRHILPNVMAPLVVATTLSVGDIILLESVLSFLGLGVQPPLASWGSMLSNAEELISSSPLLAIYPGAMIFLTVIACNLLGDALLRRYDPRDAARV